MRKVTKWFFVVDIVVLIVFTALYLAASNFEFLGYAIALLALVGVIAWSDKWFTYSPTALVLFTLWMFFHLFGGYLPIGSIRLYDVMLWPVVGDPYFILRYDQVIHAFCYFMMTFFVYPIVKPFANKKAPLFPILLITVLASAGIGSINEILEFGMVVFLESNGVGGYYNTALDIVANMVGAIIAGVVIASMARRKK